MKVKYNSQKPGDESIFLVSSVKYHIHYKKKQNINKKVERERLLKQQNNTATHNQVRVVGFLKNNPQIINLERVRERKVLFSN